MLDRHVGRESDAQLKMAVTMYQQGDIEAALSLLAQAALEDQDNLRLPATLAKLLIAQHRYDEAETLLRRLPQQIHEQSDTSHLLAHVGFLQVARKAPHEDALIAQLKADPKNLQARYELAALAVVNDNYEAALDNLLELMRNGREFKEGVGHKSLLAIFDLLGHDHKLVERYRAHMFSVLH